MGRDVGYNYGVEKEKQDPCPRTNYEDIRFVCLGRIFKLNDFLKKLF